MKKINIIIILTLFLVAATKGQGITSNDILIAQDSIHSATYDEMTVWNLRRALMEKLFSDTSLVSTDTVIANFYSSHLSDNIGKLSAIRVALDTLYNQDSLRIAAIQSNLALIDSNSIYIAYQDSILLSDTTLTGADSLAIDSLVALYDSTLAVYAAANDSIYSLIANGVQANADSITPLNNAITAGYIYEQNEIDVNNIFLNTIAVGQQDSVQNYADALYNIATQCPLKGGPAVFYARSLYHLVNDSIVYDDDRICNSPSDTCLVPTTPGLISGRSAGVCGHQFNYTIDAVPTASGYTWSIAGYAAIDSGQGSTSIWVTFTDTFVNGIISIYATDSCGSGGVRSIAVTGYPDISSSISGPNLICTNANAWFSLDSSLGASGYNWIVPSGDSIISGQGTTSAFIRWDTTAGNIIVVAYNACGSSDSTYHAVSVYLCESRITESTIPSASSGDVKMYPNPTTGKVTVIYQLNSSNGMLQLYDMIGQMVGSYQLDGNSNLFEFDIADLCCGIFSYRVTDGVNVAGQGRLVIVK